MKKFTVSEAKMLLENGSEISQVFSYSSIYLDCFVQYLLKECFQRRDRIRLRVIGWYDGVGLTLEIFFPSETDADVRIMFDSDVWAEVTDRTERSFRANEWCEIGYTSARRKDRNTAGFGSELYKDKEVKEDNGDVRSYNVGSSDYAKHDIQPWDIWREYNLNPWDADIVKRVLRTKETDGRRLDYEKIIHICKERIRQLAEYGK